MNTVTIKINGREYNLKGRENEVYLLEIAKYVDGKVRDIFNNNRKLSSTDVATLAALNIADGYFKAECEVENLTKKKNTLEERNLALRERVKEVRSEVETSLNDKDGEIQKLRNVIDSMQEKIKENEELKCKVEYLTNELTTFDNMKKEVEKLKNQVVENKNIIQLKTDECIEAKEIVTTLKIELNEIKTASEEKYNELNKEKELLENDNDKLKNLINDTNNKISKIEDENGTLKKREEEYKDKLIDLEKKHNDMIADKSEMELYEKEIAKLKEEIGIMNESIKKNLREKEFLKERNKEIKFQSQNYKYKILDLEKKLVDIQVDLAKEKKNNNVLLR